MDSEFFFNEAHLASYARSACFTATPLLLHYLSSNGTCCLWMRSFAQAFQVA